MYFVLCVYLHCVCDSMMLCTYVSRVLYRKCCGKVLLLFNPYVRLSEFSCAIIPVVTDCQ